MRGECEDVGACADTDTMIPITDHGHEFTPDPTFLVCLIPGHHEASHTWRLSPSLLFPPLHCHCQDGIEC